MREQGWSWSSPPATARARSVPDAAVTTGVQRGATGTLTVTPQYSPWPVIAGQGSFLLVWRVKDSNLGRHQPTDLQSFRPAINLLPTLDATGPRRKPARARERRQKKRWATETCCCAQPDSATPPVVQKHTPANAAAAADRLLSLHRNFTSTTMPFFGRIVRNAFVDDRATTMIMQIAASKNVSTGVEFNAAPATFSVSALVLTCGPTRRVGSSS